MHTGKSDMKEESERVVKAAAQLIKKTIKQSEHETELLQRKNLHQSF